MPCFLKSSSTEDLVIVKRQSGDSQDTQVVRKQVVIDKCTCSFTINVETKLCTVWSIITRGINKYWLSAVLWISVPSEIRRRKRGDEVFFCFLFSETCETQQLV